MRILLLSDIHANLEALEACLAAAPAYDQVIDLGDVVGYGGSPNEVTEQARQLGGVIVRGNHDRACTGQMELQGFNPIAGMAALWTLRTLTAANLDWLKSLPQGPLTVPLNNTPEGAAAEGEPDSPGAIQVAHGSPMDEDNYIIIVRDAQELLRRSDFPLTFFGHTHLQGGFEQRGERWQALSPQYRRRSGKETFQLKLHRDSKYLVNPGSVGQPRDGDRRAAFAVCDTAAYSITFYRVPYDVAKAQARIFAAGLPERLATRLAEGR